MPERTTSTTSTPAAQYPGVFTNTKGQTECFDCDRSGKVFYPNESCTLTYFALAGLCKTCLDERARGRAALRDAGDDKFRLEAVKPAVVTPWHAGRAIMCDQEYVCHPGPDDGKYFGKLWQSSGSRAAPKGP